MTFFVWFFYEKFFLVTVFICICGNVYREVGMLRLLYDFALKFGNNSSLNFPPVEQICAEQILTRRLSLAIFLFDFSLSVFVVFPRLGLSAKYRFDLRNRVVSFWKLCASVNINIKWKIKMYILVKYLFSFSLEMGTNDKYEVWWWYRQNLI